MKNKLGTYSLIFAIVGLIVFEILTRSNILLHPFWKIITAGFEAATVGGIADWFAVRALFHEIPIPFIRKHTNIIVKNREKLTLGIVDLVTNKWLSPAVISEKLDEIDMADMIIKYLKEPENQNKSIGFIRTIALKVANEMDNPTFTNAVEKIITEQISDIDIASPLGKWLEKSIKNGDHHQIWELIIEAGSKAINNPETKILLQSKLESAAKNYAQKDIFKRTTMFLAKSTGGINFTLIAEDILKQATELLKEAKLNPYHPIRVRFDLWLLDFSEKLISGDEKSLEIIDNLKNRAIAHLENKGIIRDLIIKWKTTITGQLQNNNTSLMQFFISNLNRIITNLENDKEAQSKINISIKENISQLLVKFHDEIGNMVGTSLNKLDNKELVEQIEEKVGNDLQYIRLNGAVVGGIVGIIIAVIKLI